MLWLKYVPLSRLRQQVSRHESAERRETRRNPEKVKKRNVTNESVAFILSCVVKRTMQLFIG